MKNKDADKIITQYLRIQQELKDLEKIKEEVKAQLMALDGYESDAFRVSVSEYTTTKVKGAKAIQGDSSALYEKLVSKGLIYEADCTRLNVKPLFRKAG